MTLHGLFCKTCGAATVNSEHKKIHDMNGGEVMIWTEHSDQPAVEITDVRSDAYRAEVVETGAQIEIPYEDLDNFRLPFEEEDFDRPDLEEY